MDSLLISQPLQVTFAEVLLNIVAATVMGLLVAFLYRSTHKGMSYSESFVISLVIITVIASMVVMIIGNSLVRAFGLIGAFTVIRFRTAIKEVRDMTFMFFALSLGLATGVKAYSIAAVGLLAVSALILVLDKVRFGAIGNFEYLLTFIEKPDREKGNPHDEIFKKYLSDSLFLNIRPLKGGDEMEFSYNVRLKDPKDLSNFTQSLSKLKAIQNVELISVQRDIEY